MKRIFPLSIIILCLASCAVGPDYKAPVSAEMGVPTNWHATLPHAGNVAELARWWTQFDDPVLTRLIEAAELNSPSVAMALARVRAARASVTINRGNLLPVVSGSGSIMQTNTKTSVAGTDTTADTTTKLASADAAWEIDLFGGSRRSLEGSKARLLSAEAGWHDARITLAADVANTYATARAYQGLISLYEQELASHQSTEKLTALLIHEGRAPSANALATEASTANSTSILENQRGLYTRLLNGLVVLTGLTYREVEIALAPDLGAVAIPQIRAGAGIALPASVVVQRPDVRTSEYQLAAASADIGVAVADLLPSLTLIGSIGINSSRTSGTTLTTRSWSFGPSLNVPLFTGGRAKARVEAMRAAYDLSLAAYHATVQRAVQDIEDSLTRVDTVARRGVYADKAAQNFRAYFDSISESYRLGKSSLLELENSRLQSLGSQEALMLVELERAQAWIAVYRAAGGSWDSPIESTH